MGRQDEAEELLVERFVAPLRRVEEPLPDEVERVDHGGREEERDQHDEEGGTGWVGTRRGTSVGSTSMEGEAAAACNFS